MRTGRELFHHVCEAGDVAAAIAGLTGGELARLHDFLRGHKGFAEVMRLQCKVEASGRFFADYQRKPAISSTAGAVGEGDMEETGVQIPESREEGGAA